jgi:RNA polymerase sigma-70 factor (ECF subfamily)
MADTTPPKTVAGVSGDPAWLAALYAEHGPGLRRFVTGILRDPDAAEDVVQTTFARATNAAGTISPEAIKAWLYRVAFHEAITCKRRAGVDRKATQELGARQRAQDPERAEELLVRRELIEQVREAMESLPASQRQVVQARVYQGKTFAQIAAEMGVPLGTALTHMRRALEKLRRKLTPHD